MRRKRPTILVTGGPTRAYLDEVRFLTNLSTGALAFELCKQLKALGANVVAVMGPTSLDFESLRLAKLERVETNGEMQAAIYRVARAHRPEWGIFSAAVLDFEPVKRRAGKVSSDVVRWDIRLRPAPKILDSVGKKFPKMKRVAFKLEAKKRSKTAAMSFAKSYLRKKGVEALVFNEVSHIGSSDHRARIFTANAEIGPAPGKQKLAQAICRLVLSNS